MSESDSSSSSNSSGSSSLEDENEDNKGCGKEKEGSRKIIDIKSILGKIDQPIREPTLPTKSSDEILSELFGVFNAQPPQIKDPEPTVLKTEVKDKDRKSKKSKKKHKHKHKKHKKRKYEEGNKSGSKSKHKKHKKEKKKRKSRHSSKDRVENAEKAKSKDLVLDLTGVEKVPDLLKVSESITDKKDKSDKSEENVVENKNVNLDNKDIQIEHKSKNGRMDIEDIQIESKRLTKQGELSDKHKAETDLVNDEKLDLKSMNGDKIFVKNIKNEKEKDKQDSEKNNQDLVIKDNERDSKTKWLSISRVVDTNKELHKTKEKCEKESLKIMTEKQNISSSLITSKTECSVALIQVVEASDRDVTKPDEYVSKTKSSIKHLEEEEIRKSRDSLEGKNVVKTEDCKSVDIVEDKETKNNVDKCRKEHQKSSKREREKECINKEDNKHSKKHKKEHKDKRNSEKEMKNKETAAQNKIKKGLDVNVDKNVEDLKSVKEGKLSNKEISECSKEKKKISQKQHDENTKTSEKKDNEVNRSGKDVKENESKLDKTCSTERERKATEAETIRAEIEELKLQIIKKETKKLNQNMKDKNSISRVGKTTEESAKESSAEVTDVISSSSLTNEKEVSKKEIAEVDKENEIMNVTDKPEIASITYKPEIVNTIVSSLEDVPLPPQPAGANDKKSCCKKITIKNLKFSSVFEETIRQVEEEARLKAEKLEEGEIIDSSPESSHQLSADDEIDPMLGNVIKCEESESQGDEKKSLENISITIKQDRKRHSSKSSSGEKASKHKEKRKKKRSGSHSHHKKHKSRSKSRHKSKSRSSSRNRSRKRHRSSSEKRDNKNRRKSRGSSRSDESPERFDKKKLLEIARKNVVSMCKQGALPSSVVSQDKVLAIKAGGKSVAELTDFCKQLSKKEAEEGPSGSDKDSSDGDTEQAFHHPFQIKERPSSIVVNIRNSVQLPLKTLKEKAAEQSKQLRIQFPVSSGQQHRKTESEWIPVSPKKEAPPQPAVSAKVQAARLAAKQKNIFSANHSNQELDIGSIVSQRLSAMRKLQENPNDVQAINQMYSAQRAMQTWAESKQEPGQFTGSTGARVLSAAELSAGYQAWAKKDQFREAVPVSGGMGMTLLQKMGWRPGEGLGKNKEGSLEPLTLEIKMDKKGLMAQEDFHPIPLPPPVPAAAPPPPVPPAPTVVPVPRGKHPVSILVESCTKRRWGAPQFELCFECGPDHKKHFLFKVRVNGTEYKPSVASPNKKQAKAEAAAVCLNMLGIPIT